MATVMSSGMEKPHMLRMFISAIVVLAVLVAPDGVLAQGTETVVYFHTDAIGSVRMTTDANAQVLQRYDYLPFGEPWPSPTPPETRRFRRRGARSGDAAEPLRRAPVLSANGTVHADG